MKKSTFAFIAFFLIIAFFFPGCSKDNPAKSVDWEHIIQTDFFSGENNVSQAMADAVSFRVELLENQISVTVTAPDICKDLLDWVESVSDADFTEAALEAEILRLLKDSKKTEVDYVLSFTLDGENAHIHYTPQFGEAMTCGLTRFYAEVTQRILDEMEDEVR